MKAIACKVMPTMMVVKMTMKMKRRKSIVWLRGLEGMRLKAIGMKKDFLRGCKTTWKRKKVQRVRWKTKKTKKKMKKKDRVGGRRRKRDQRRC